MNIKRRTIISSAFFAVITAFFALSLTAEVFSARTASAADLPLVFPPAPNKAKIKYIETISDSREFAARRSWWKKIVRVFSGGDQTARISRPYGVEVSGKGWMYVCDPGAGLVHCFKGKKKGYMTIPRKGRLSSPIDAAVDNGGRVFVTDSKEGDVFCYDEEGGLKYRFNADLKRPTGIAYHKKTRRLYVVDTAQQKVFIFEPNGSAVGCFGSRGSEEGRFNYPADIFIDSGGLVYVSDAMNFRIQIFDSEGNFQGKFGKLGDGTGDFSRPKGVAADSAGNIYVVDALFDAVQIFDREGRLLLTFGSPGQAEGKFWLPTGINIDGRDRIYVADSYNNRIQVFQYLGE